jgi:predicted outer membrane repeat protein
VGTTISVVASYTDGGGTLESVASAATAPVANLNDDPTGTVTITGTPTEDETLTASNNLADEDGLGTISYQWRSNGANVGTGGVTFNLTQAAVGTTISVVASYTDGQGTPESVASAATAIVANVNDDPTGTVTITGTPTEGEVLSADTSTLADEDGLGTLGYQWQAGGVDIASANAIDYMLTAAEIGSNITVVVSYTDGQGTPESVTSAAVGPVTAAVETLALELTPGILFVDIDATGIADGSSWADAYNHPQDALDKAQPGDEIWVAEGVYAQRAAPDSYVITMVDGVDLYGGFSGVEAILSERDINAHLTVLDGEDSVDGVYGAQDARLDGIAVTRAMSSGMRNDSVSPTVMNCIFEDNGFMGGVSGGAIQNISGANAYISDSTFVNNSGSAIFNENSSPMINNSSFYNNYGDSGGAIQNQGINSQPVITNCLFDGNTAAQLGGAVYNSEGEPTLINSTIVENTAGVDGGGVASESGQGRGPTIINSILWNNSGLEIFDDLSSLTSAFYSNIEGGYSGTGNIDLDPSFVDAAAGDYSLAPGSPCIDAGDNASVSTSFDLNGDPRITNGTVDMGAYEYTP